MNERQITNDVPEFEKPFSDVLGPSPRQIGTVMSYRELGNIVPDGIVKANKALVPIFSNEGEQVSFAVYEIRDLKKIGSYQKFLEIGHDQLEGALRTAHELDYHTLVLPKGSAGPGLRLKVIFMRNAEKSYSDADISAQRKDTLGNILTLS